MLQINVHFSKHSIWLKQIKSVGYIWSSSASFQSLNSAFFFSLQMKEQSKKAQLDNYMAMSRSLIFIDNFFQSALSRVVTVTLRIEE